DLRKLVEREVDAVIGDAALRKIIGADALRAIARADLFLAVGGALSLHALPLGIIDARAQDVHGGGAILVLRAAVLHHHHDAGRGAGDADRRFRLVDVLAARALPADCLEAPGVVLDLAVYILYLRQRAHPSRPDANP